MADALSIFDVEAIEEPGQEINAHNLELFGEEEEADDDFIDDDDGGGYKEDLRKQEGYQEYQSRSKKESLKALAQDKSLFQEFGLMEEEGGGGGERRGQEQVQAAFQSASTPAKGNREYLCFNMQGTVCQITSSSADRYPPPPLSL